MRDPSPSVLLILREAGERTLDACLAGLRAQLPDERVRVLRERPFSAAVRRGLEIGASERPEWLFTLDADVLLTPTAIADLLALCESAPGDCFHVKGLLVCRFFGGTQPRGFHAFRGSLLERALGCSGRDPHTTRPETAIVRRMEALGHRSVYAGTVLGLHDHGQWLRHVYLKMLLRTQKTADLPLLRRRMKSLERTHPDFLVAGWGLDDGAAMVDPPREFDWETPQPAFERRMRETGLREKPALSTDDAAALFADTERALHAEADPLSFALVRPGDAPVVYPLSA